MLKVGHPDLIKVKLDSLGSGDVPCLCCIPGINHACAMSQKVLKGHIDPIT